MTLALLYNVIRTALVFRLKLHRSIVIPFSKMASILQTLFNVPLSRGGSHSYLTLKTGLETYVFNSNRRDVEMVRLWAHSQSTSQPKRRYCTICPLSLKDLCNGGGGECLSIGVVFAKVRLRLRRGGICKTRVISWNAETERCKGFCQGIRFVSIYPRKSIFVSSNCGAGYLSSAINECYLQLVPRYSVSR